MIRTIEWKNGKVKIIDQTQLPLKLKYLYCGNIISLWAAIKKLKVRGAPALGIAGGLGVVLGTKDSKTKSPGEFLKRVDYVAKYLGSSRPTAVNLFWALERMRKTAAKNAKNGVASLKKTLLKEALMILEEDRRTCRKMAGYGASLVKSGDTILTHCNAGALATADFGTALGVMYEAKRQGKKIRVYADETRPLLQGARLSAWELKQAGIDVTLICDNMAATLMKQGKIDKVIVGADRIASNGDAANKIGTYSLAVLCKYHKVPFYVAAPVSTFDLSLKSGKDIPIEERHPDEVFTFAGKRTAPRGIKAYNPAFDVTPNGLITAIITEKGIFKKPFRKNLKKLR
ncbi:MAG: S-methyl-5-thioribose-1-phosphate isomerase [Candidatus Omnitrophota bacterium]